MKFSRRVRPVLLLLVFSGFPLIVGTTASGQAFLLLGAPLAIILLVVLAQAIAGMILVPVTRRVMRRSEEASVGGSLA
jgi:uncharacterized protein (DUF58 family)